MSDLLVFNQCNLLHTQEEIRRYRPGGFHPVSLGDKFKDGRYQIYHKLGWGGFSTVWLARDHELQRWVSLKITAADIPKPSQELRILQELRQKRAAHRVVQLLDYFIHEGPNGCHQCLVFELLGPSVDAVVADYHMGGDDLDAPIILRITRQLLQAISAIHRAGYAHGDISGSNLIFTARRLNRSSIKSIFKTIGAPESEKLTYSDDRPLPLGIPEQLVEKTSWDDWIDEDEEDVRIIDFGQAFLRGAEPIDLAEPRDLQVPEKIFGGHFDYRVDLWRAGCTIYTIVFGVRPFHYFDAVDALVAQMIHFVEELPEEWTAKWDKLKVESGFDWSDIPDRMPAQSKLEERFERKDLDPSLRRLLPIIKGLIRLRPEDRISADEALRLLDT